LFKLFSLSWKIKIINKIKNHLGVLPITFVNKSDYDKITSKYLASTEGLSSIAPGKPLYLTFKSIESGKSFKIEAKHTMSDDQIDWFKAGSALNLIASQQQKL